MIKKISLLALTLACSSPFEPSVEFVEFIPDQSYQIKWNEVEQCLGMKSDYNRIKWFKVSSEFDTPIGRADGMYIDGKIYIYNMNRIKHEMIHAISLIMEHPSNLFPRCEI